MTNIFFVQEHQRLNVLEIEWLKVLTNKVGTNIDSEVSISCKRVNKNRYLIYNDKKQMKLYLLLNGLRKAQNAFFCIYFS